MHNPILPVASSLFAYCSYRTSFVQTSMGRVCRGHGANIIYAASSSFIFMQPLSPPLSLPHFEVENRPRSKALRCRTQRDPNPQSLLTPGGGVHTIRTFIPFKLVLHLSCAFSKPANREKVCHLYATCRRSLASTLLEVCGGEKLANKGDCVPNRAVSIGRRASRAE